MAPHNEQTGLEQTLTERLARLSVPIRILRHDQANGGYWYQWNTMLTGTGDCGTFADAVIGAITYQQEQREAQRLIATPAHYTSETATTLGACLRRTRHPFGQRRSSICTWARRAGWRVCRRMTWS